MCQGGLFNYGERGFHLVHDLKKTARRGNSHCEGSPQWMQSCFIYFAEVTAMTPGEDN